MIAEDPAIQQAPKGIESVKFLWVAILSTGFFLSACGKGEQQSGENGAEAPPTSTFGQPLSPSAGTRPVITGTTESPSGGNGGTLTEAQGLALAQANGCLACHRIDSKLVGPAWRDVSRKYKGDPNARERLIHKVKKGGQGSWTDVTGGIAMPPYSPRVSDEDIEKLVSFVLSL